MKTKFALLTLAAASVLASTSALRAADPAPTAPATPPAAAPERPGGRGGQRGDRVAALKEQLGLTPEQVEKLKPILTGEREKIQALRADTTLTQEARMEKLKELQKSSEEEIKPILTAEQIEKWKVVQEKRREAMAKRRAEQAK